MIILGIDPGVARTGWCALEVPDGAASPPKSPKCLGLGVIETPASDALDARLASLTAGIKSKIDTWSPTAMAVEELFFMKKSASVLRVAQARGAVIAVAAGRGIEIFEYNPVSVKKTLTGYGSASKSQMQSMIKTILRLSKPPTPDDAADAAAVALCHYYTRGRYR